MPCLLPLLRDFTVSLTDAVGHLLAAMVSTLEMVTKHASYVPNVWRRHGGCSYRQRSRSAHDVAVFLALSASLRPSPTACVNRGASMPRLRLGHEYNHNVWSYLY